MKEWQAKLCQIEIPVTDIEESLEFFDKVFGWARVPIEIHNYFVLTPPSDVGYGISLVPQSAPIKKGQQVTLYFALPDEEALAEVVEKVPRWGGQVPHKARQVPGYGLAQIITDPSGNRFGFFIANTKPKI